MKLTLRCKRLYIQAILEGHKNAEYRADSAFYRRIFKNRKRYTVLRLHNQNGVEVTADIVRIDRRNTPKKIPKDCIPTKKCFVIKITNPRRDSPCKDGILNGKREPESETTASS